MADFLMEAMEAGIKKKHISNVEGKQIPKRNSMLRDTTFKSQVGKESLNENSRVWTSENCLVHKAKNSA